MGESLGQLVHRLREQRQLTQLQLAAAARVGNGTISRIENDDDSQVRRSTMGRVLKALADVKQLSASDFAQFVRLSGLERVTSAVQAAASESPTSLSDFTGAMSPDVARCHWMLADMIDRVGVLPILKLLEGVAQIASMAVEPPVDSPRTFTHHGPKVQRPGYVEQIVTDFDVIPNTPAKPTARKTGG